MGLLRQAAIAIDGGRCAGPGGVEWEVPVASQREERPEDRVHMREEKHNNNLLAASSVRSR
jgi:hypothetical protein